MGGGGQSSGGGGPGSYFSTPQAAMSDAYSQGGGGFNWGAVGRGIQNAGTQFAQGAGQTPNFMTALPQLSSAQQYAPFDVGAQGKPIATNNDADMQALQDALRRIEATNKSTGVKIPDMGAAKYWYVDPRAPRQFDPMADERSNQSQLEQWATQPSF